MELSRREAEQRSKELELQRVEQQLRSAQAELHKRDLAAKAMQAGCRCERESKSNLDHDISVSWQVERRRREAGVDSGKPASMRRTMPPASTSPVRGSYAEYPSNDSPPQEVPRGNWAISTAAPPSQSATVATIQRCSSPLAPPPLIGEGDASDVSELLAACNAYVDNIVRNMR